MIICFFIQIKLSCNHTKIYAFEYNIFLKPTLALAQCPNHLKFILLFVYDESNVRFCQIEIA